MKFYYKNSDGRTIDLSKPPFLGEKSNNLFGFEWTYLTQGQAIQRIVKFEKYMIKKKFHVLVSGNTEREYYDNLEKFLQLTDVDINNLQMGRLYVGDYYLECYIFASGKPKQYLGTNKTLIECSIICERGNWFKDDLRIYRPASVAGEASSENNSYTGTGILYPYDYQYDYSVPFDKNTIINESYMDTDIEITFYGAVVNPEITIGGNTYRVNYELNANESLVINTRNKTAVAHVVKNNQPVEENVFKYRDRNHDIFAKIHGGYNTMLMGNDLSVDVRLFLERSEPKWSDEIWT